MITFYYWFESPYNGRMTGSVSSLVIDEFEVGPTLKSMISNGLIIHLNDGLKRYIAPHQLIDTIIEVVKEKKEDAKVETPDTPRDEVLPIRTPRSRKVKGAAANGV